MDDVFSKIPKNIKRLRQRKGLTQEDLAERCYCSRVTISHLETGDQPVSLDMIVTLAKALDIDWLELIFSDWKDLASVCSKLALDAKDDTAANLIRACADIAEYEKIKEFLDIMIPQNRNDKEE